MIHSDDEPQGPEWEAYKKRVREELIPKIEGSGLFLAVVPADTLKTDVKFAIELGLAVLYDKPIIALIRPGTEIPEKLSRVVERFVEMDPANMADCKERLKQAMTELAAEQDSKN